MKLATTLLLAGLLVAAASALSAADQPATPDLQQTAQASTPAVGSPAVAAPSASATGCDPAAAPLVPLPVAQAGVSASSLACGSCSDANCVGAPRGQICNLSGGGWGHCNIFSGGNLCSTGGWECQCEAGPLP